ncbi:Fc.00g029010.m01.CDS01 [Cosmosporella sp. VM-42]
MSAMSGPSRNRTVSMSSGRSSRGRAAQVQDFTANMQPAKHLKFFDPSAATASMFLYAQGSSVVCCHHDTLTIERRFSRHSDEVQLLAVDNQSDVGGGRFVVSYDAGQTAIVWDLMTGDEVARFASYEHLTVAAWMKSGNVAFGNTQGSVIQFEPTTSEHISTRTLDQIAVTALAPSSDCRTFAIGYQNGSLLVATLQPRFTILHNLTTSRGPSPIVTLAWHASSSRQKSDMLAVQTHDGDLRVWSVTKSYNAEDPAKIVRVLRRTENFLTGPNWMGWSKNGRIIQYSDSETLSWDVRTKHVTYDSIPTLEHVRGLAVYGPGASLFTLGPNNTVQQFDLNSPAIMVANVQHPANLLPPSPPVSIEEQAEQSAHSATTINTSESETSSIPLDTVGISESDDDHLSPFARLAKRQVPDSGNEMYESASPVSSRSGLSSLSKSSAGSRTPGRYPGSMKSRGMTENTYISAGSSLRSSTVGKQKDVDTYSMGYSLGTTSGPSMASTSRSHKPSRLRHEVPRSPDDNKVHDLFKYTRTRLSDIPYKHPMSSNYARLTNDDLRRQMLSTIFGWNKEIEDLVRDEMSRHPQGSASRILLSKWLGDIDADVMATSAENMTSSDWMLLALSGIGGQASQHKLGRAYVQRLLESGDVHAAVTIMLGMGDHNDAIEIYISHRRYMEALILSCMAFPSVWERQAAIIRKWGEWAVQHGQQQLAIRCFACTDQESTEPWTSPSAAQLNFQSLTPSIPEILSPPLSPPGIQRGPQRSIAKTSALKLITSFGDQQAKSKFFSQGDGGQTPIAAGATPIAESAVSPGGASHEATTAFLRPSNNSRFNTPTSARGGGPSFGRGRLPSIGEIPSDLNREALKTAAIPPPPPPPVDQRGHVRASSGSQDNMAAGIALQRAATASPMMMRDRHQRVVRPYEGERPPSPDSKIMMKMEQARSNRRNGSRDRIPFGVSMQLQSLERPETTEVTSPEQSVTSSTRFHWPSRRRGPGSVASSVTSASSAGRSLRQQATRNREDYIHSLDAANHYSKRARSRHGSRERSRGRHGSRERSAVSRETSEERGRGSARGWVKPKRSPTSPIPMSPEDLINLSTPKTIDAIEPLTVRKASGPKVRPGSRTSSRGSRRKSPDGRPRPPALDIRGRSKGRDGSLVRSPSSPLPMSATVHYQGSEDEEDFRRAMEEQELFRAKHSRSASRGLNSPLVSVKRDRSESRRRRANSEAADVLGPLAAHGRATSTEHAGDLRAIKDERQRKKEQAARELEERRKSLAKRPQAPPIPHPNDFTSPALRIGVEMADAGPEEFPRSATEPPKSMYARNGPVIGLPATPKAMRLIIENDHSGNSSPQPEVPPIPATFAQRHSPQTSPHSSPKKEEVGDLLTLLPSTVYQPPKRPLIPRSMSAPIPDEPQSHYRRKGSTSELRGIDELVGGERRRSHEDPIPPPPPPPPAPMMLKELQHLATPPPPPPAPLPHAHRGHEGGAIGSGMIEIVMDDDENSGNEPTQSTLARTPSKGHSRGRSIGDSSISGRFSKATERLRSASRSRKDPRQMKSPPFEAPYESIPTIPLQLKSPPPMMYDPDMIRSPVDTHSKHMSTGLHRSEMI